MTEIKFTKKALSDAAIGDSPIKVYHPRIKGFYAYLQQTTRTYYLLKRIKGGKPVRVKLGNVTTLPVNDAERLANHCINLLDQGINPNKERIKQREAEEKAKKESRRFLLGPCFEAFLSRGDIKLSTKLEYESRYRVHLKHWEALDIRDIDPSMCEELHKTSRFPNRVCKAIILLGGIYDYHAIRNEKDFNTGWDLKFKNIKKRIGDQWNDQPPKEQAIVPKSHVGLYAATCEAFAFNSVFPARKPHFAAMLLALLTGVRFGECSKLKWSNIDFDTQVITLHHTKTKNRTHKVYMSAYTKEFLRKWRYSRKTKSQFVFPLASNPAKHIGRRHAIYEELAQGLELESFGTHANRRTFTCVCEQLGISEHRIQNMINHSVKGNNVTRTSYLKLMKFDPQTAGEDFSLVGDHMFKVAQQFRRYQSTLTEKQQAYLEAQLGPAWDRLLREDTLDVSLPEPELEKLKETMLNLAEDLEQLRDSSKKLLFENLDPRVLNALKDQVAAMPTDMAS